MITVKVTGMTCGHCEGAVQKAVAAVPGVTRVVEVSREKQRVVVEGNAELGAVLAAIKEEGYEAEAAA